MSRDFVINGEALVLVKGGAHLSGIMSDPVELGLTDRDGIVRISPIWYHYDKKVDDFGPNVPAEVIQNIAECWIDMTLVHYDSAILDRCISEALGGTIKPNSDLPITLVGAGRPLGGYKALFASGNHYISLNIAAPISQIEHHFPATYLAAPPLEIPLGTRRSHVRLQWRAIPYGIPGLVSGFQGQSQSTPIIVIDGVPHTSGKEICSSGRVLWDHNLDLDLAYE